MEATGGAEPERGAADSSGRTYSGLSGLPENHLCLRLALVGRHRFAGAGCRQCADAVAHSWQEQARPLRALAAVDAATAARSLAHPSLAAVAVPGAHAARAGP